MWLRTMAPFDLVTIGLALHWMDREATLATFDRILAPGGRILICGSNAVPGEVNQWVPALRFPPILGRSS
jgi:ubiquinone/menaquinone biosynthesis C-methylase UbiE